MAPPLREIGFLVQAAVLAKAQRRKGREGRRACRGIQEAKLEVVYRGTGLSYLVRYFPGVLSLIVEVKVYGIDRGE